MTSDYPLFVKWRYITMYLLDIYGKFPKNVRFNLVDRITSISLDVLERIIEAIYAKQKYGILSKANLGIEKLRALMHISVEREHISVRQFEYISGEINEAGKMLGGWQKTCKE